MKSLGVDLVRTTLLWSVVAQFEFRDSPPVRAPDTLTGRSVPYP